MRLKPSEGDEKITCVILHPPHVKNLLASYMIIISYGMVKSASSFTFQLVSGACVEHCNAVGGECYALGGILDEFSGNFVATSSELEDVVIELSGLDIDWGCNFIVIKTHSAPTPRLIELLPELPMCVVANFRDPAEIALSLRDVVIKENHEGVSRFNKKYIDLKNSHGGLKFHEKNFLSWVNNIAVHEVFYDEIVCTPVKVLRRLSHTLGLQNVDADKIVSGYLHDKSKIREFNKGELLRANHELSAEEYAGFRRLYPELYTFVDRSRNML